MLLSSPSVAPRDQCGRRPSTTDEDDLAVGRHAQTGAWLARARGADGGRCTVLEQDRIAAHGIEHVRPAERPMQAHRGARGEREQHLRLLGPGRGGDHDAPVAHQRRLRSRWPRRRRSRGRRRRGRRPAAVRREHPDRAREGRRRRERASQGREPDDLARLRRALVPSVQREDAVAGSIGHGDSEPGVPEEGARLVAADGEHLGARAGGVQEVAVLGERVHGVAEPLTRVAVHAGERLVVPNDPRQLASRRQGIIRDRRVERDGLRQIDLEDERPERDLAPHDPDEGEARGDLPGLHDRGARPGERPIGSGLLRGDDRERQEHGRGQGDQMADGRVHGFHVGTS